MTIGLFFVISIVAIWVSEYLDRRMVHSGH